MAQLDRKAHLESLLKGNIQTSYVQFDQMESIVKTRTQPYGIELAIRAKTGEILSARVCRIPIKAFQAEKEVKQEWNKNINQKKVLKEVFREIKLALKKKAIVESDHGYSEEQIYNLCPEARHDLKDGRSMWRINQVCVKLRQNISRLRRRTWAVG